VIVEVVPDICVVSGLRSRPESSEEGLILGVFMAGFIVFQDGRAYAAANWAYDVTVERIAVALPDTDAGRSLASWLRQQRSYIKGTGLGSVDLRESASENQRLLERAARRAKAIVDQKGT